MSDVKRLLAAATPLPWQIDDTSDATYDLCCGDSTPDDHTHVQTAWFRGEVGKVDVGDYNTLSLADGLLIEYAVNRLPDYEAAVEALERLLLFVGASADKFSTVQDARAALARLREPVPA